MHKLSSLVAGLAVVALGGGFAYAADKKMIAEEGAVEVLLLRQQSIQRELKLTDAEIEKAHKHCATQWAKAQEANGLSPSEADKKFAEMERENQRFIETTLTKEQQKRLNEITLQVAGLLSLTRHHIASQLGLTAEQKTRAKEMQQEARREADELLEVKDKTQQRAKLKELRATTRKKINELLTDAQEAKWREMTGAPFNGDLAFFDPNDTTTK